MKIETQKVVWYDKLAKFLSQNPFYHGEQTAQIQEWIQQLGEAIEQGDSCLKLENTEISDDFIAIYQPQQTLHKPLIWDAPYLYLQRYWSLEHKLAQSIQVLLDQQIEQPNQNYTALFDDPHQQAALKKGISLPFCMITGGPGTGKTFILTRIVAVLKKLNPSLRIAMAAPTGKAAQRMQEALQLAFSDKNLLQAGLYHEDFKTQETQTLHRLLKMGNRQIPQYHQDNPLPYDVVVVDESSMLDLSMAQALFSAIKPPTRLLLLGDANQLSSVDVGYVLSDLQQVPQLKEYQQNLVKSRRFFDDAMIGRFAHYIYQGTNCIKQDANLFAKANQQKDFSVEQWQAVLQPYVIDEKTDFNMQFADQQDWVGYYEINNHTLNQNILKIYKKIAQGFDDYILALKAFKNKEIDKKQLAEQFDRYRILVAMRHGQLGLHQINQMMTQYVQHALKLHEIEWYLGRPVMMTYNDYQIGLSNGDIGICYNTIDPNTDEERYQVYFPSLDRDIAVARLPQSIQTAYALTIHKSQGSEFRHVAVVLDEEAERLLSKELLYTAITRAKKMVSLYASVMSIQQSLKMKTQRQSGLTQQITRILI